MNTVCMQCYFGKHWKWALSYGDEKTATAFSKALMQEFLAQPDTVDSAYMGSVASKLSYQFFGKDPGFRKEEKEMSNRFVMERLDMIRQMIDSAEDSLFAAVQFAVLGNYLDFHALQDRLSFDELEQMLRSALEIDLDKACYESLKKDLQSANRLLYLTDNAGEIVFDMLLAEQIQKCYRQVKITFCVRGGIIVNDATREDAEAIGLPFDLIDSGVAIGGTHVELISPEAKSYMDAADVIIAKGMGNTESMLGCGYNVYYAFLVKCPRFVEYFNKPMMTPMLLKEK